MGHMIKDQLHNPSFSEEEQQVLGNRTVDYIYKTQIAKLANSEAEINKYIGLYDCLASNDEDCGVTVHSVCSHEPHEGGVESTTPTDVALPSGIESPGDVGSGSGYQINGYQSTGYSFSGDRDNEEVTTPTRTEEVEIYDPVTKTCEHVFVVKMIPPFIRDSRNDIQSTEKPTSTSPTGSKVVPSITEIISPSTSTEHIHVEPSNQNIPEDPVDSTANPTTTEDDNRIGEGDTTVLDGVPNSELLQGNPSGSSSCYLSSTVSLILVSIASCTLLQLSAF